MIDSSQTKQINIKLPFALRNGILVHISQVVSGSDCDSICPYCSTQLIAKKGDINEHHFAHISGIECNLAFETALQILGKSILEKYKRIVLPPLYFRNSGIQIFSASEYQIEKVIFQKSPNTGIPNILVYINSTPLLVEIGVVQNIEWFTRLNDYSAVKINICSVLNLKNEIAINGEVIEKHIITGITNKKWIKNNKHDQISKKIEALETLKLVSDVGLTAYPIIVQDCPLEKRIWKSGKRSGQSYASVFDDCSICAFGRIIKEEKYFNNEKTDLGKIRAVGCCGDKQSHIDRIIEMFNTPDKQRKG